MDQTFKSSAVLFAGERFLAYRAIAGYWEILYHDGTFVGGEDRLKDYTNYKIVKLYWETIGPSGGPVKFEVSFAERYEDLEGTGAEVRKLQELSRNQADYVLRYLVDNFPRFWFEKSKSPEILEAVAFLRHRARPSLLSRWKRIFFKE